MTERGAVPMEQLHVRRLVAADSEAMRALNRACPIVADLTLRFDREPDFFAWPNQVFDRHEYVGGFVDGALIGFAMIGYQWGWVGDEMGWWGYGGDARVHPAYRRQGLAQRLARALGQMVPAEVPFVLMLVKRGNLPGERLLSVLPVPPGRTLETVADMDAVTLPAWGCRAPVGRPLVERLCVHTLARAAEFCAARLEGRLLAPEVTVMSLRPYADGEVQSACMGWVATSGGRIVGILTARDLHAVRQTTVLRYSAASWPLRAAWRAALLAGLARVPLPASGEAIRGLTVTLLATEADGGAALARTLIATAAREAQVRGLHMVHVGFVGDDPLRRAISGWPRSTMRSQLVAGVGDDAIGSFRAALAARPPYLNLALA